MATWPYDADLEAIIAGTTTAKKTWADGIMAAIKHVFAGTKTLRALEVAITDGVGTAAAGQVLCEFLVTRLAGGITAQLGSIIATVGNLKAAAGYLYTQRIYNAGTALVTGDFSISGWGATGAVLSVRGGDTMGDLTVQAGGGGEIASPTITFNVGGAGHFKDGTFTNAPIAHAYMLSAPSGAQFFPVRTTATANGLILTIDNLTAVDGETFIIGWHVLGRSPV